MDWLFNFAVPLASAFISGLFTFLGVRHTIKNENKRFREERLARDNELKNQEYAKNKEINELIIKDRPQFVIVEDTECADETVSVRLLPQTNYKINSLLAESNEERLTFNYPDKVLDDDYWDKYSVTLKNVGNACQGCFLHLPDKSGVNIYDSDYFNETNFDYLKDYSEKAITPAVNNGKTLKIVIYYPKSMLIYKDVQIDLFSYDENDNCWRQDDIICQRFYKESYPISFDEYYLNNNEELVHWQVVRRMFDHNLSEKVEMKIDNSLARPVLELKRKEYNKKIEEFKQFSKDVLEGKILLNSKPFPLYLGR